MHKIIAELFEIDLSTTDINITEENYWFSDTFMTKYSFPFSVPLTDEMKVVFEDLIDYRSFDNTIEFDVTYVFNDIMEKGVLLVSSITDVINLQLKYGIEEFPNFNKKLSEIGLQNNPVSDIYAHAETIISQTWPDVNYNFPQIHTDKIDTTQAMWTYFEKILNNYKDGNFVINEVVDDEPHNRNLMQPLPYFGHILTQGFADAGYTLKGDILDNEIFKKQLLYANTDYHKILDQVNINTILMGTDKIETSGGSAEFLKQIDLPQGGRYRVTGSAYIFGMWKKHCSALFKYRDKVIWSVSKYEKRHHTGYMYYWDLDFTFDTIADGEPHELFFYSLQLDKNDSLICDFNVTSVFLYDESGAAIPNVVNNNAIELNRVVPDLTFGSFVTMVKNWYNLDISLKGKEIWMNYIENEINYKDAIDLTEFQTTPEREYNLSISFLLKFMDPSDEKNKHQEVFFNSDGYVVGGKKEDNTSEIIIDAFPLKNKVRGVQTAYAIENDTGKIYVVLYNGLNGDSLNLTEDPAAMLLPEIAPTYYKNWFDFRFYSVNFRWSFTAFTEHLNGLNVKRKIFAYGRYFIQKTLTKRQIGKDQFDIDIDAYTVK